MEAQLPGAAHEVVEELLKAKRGAGWEELAVALVGPPDSRLRFVRAEEGELLAALAGATTDKEIGVSVDIRSRARSWRASNRRSAWKLLASLPISRNALEAELIAGLLDNLNVSEICELAEHDHKLLHQALDQNPGTTSRSGLWRRSIGLQNTLWAALSGVHFDAAAAAVAMLNANSCAVAKDLAELAPAEVVGALMSWWSADETHSPPQKWLDVATGFAPELLRWATDSDNLPSPAPLAFVVEHAKTASLLEADIDIEAWKGLAAWIPLQTSGSRADYLAAVLWHFASRLDDRGVELLAVAAFRQLHRKAVDDALDNRSWLLIEPTLPRCGWLQRHSPAERLRRGIVDLFYRGKWSASYFLPLTDDERAFELLAERGKRILGPKFLRQVSKEAETSSAQARVLKRILRRKRRSASSKRR